MTRWSWLWLFEVVFVLRRKTGGCLWWLDCGGCRDACVSRPGRMLGAVCQSMTSSSFFFYFCLSYCCCFRYCLSGAQEGLLLV